MKERKEAFIERMKANGTYEKRKQESIDRRFRAKDFLKTAKQNPDYCYIKELNRYIPSELMKERNIRVALQTIINNDYMNTKEKRKRFITLLDVF